MRWGRLQTVNYRGRPVPRVLGIALAGAGIVGTAAAAAFGDVGSAGWGALAGCLLVSAAGLVDDVAPAGPRGLREHLRAVAAGRMTTGILKLVVTIGAAVVVVALQPPVPGHVRLAAIVLLAAATNAWNGLDVRPGRALKAFLLPALVFLVWGGLDQAPVIAGLLVGCVLLLPLDLGERAMLGDAGSNLLGFAAGLALVGVLPGLWVAAAAGVAVALNVLAETVTLSRIIDATPPLRFLDRLGRRT
jgi:UDP-GlcNAc:undecaprenyl-phosphate GlcNAc-1-phosphate transferase